MKTKILALILLTLLWSCSVIKVIEPERVPYDKPTESSKTSTVALHASISQEDVANAIRSEIKNPVVADEPISAVATILAIETVTEEELVKEIIRPYTPGHWIDVVTKTTETVREAFGCWINPFKWGKCWKNVVKDVWVTTKVWVEPQAEIFKWVAHQVVKLIDKVYKADVRIHYPTDLTGFDINFSQDKFEANATFVTHLKFDYDQNIIPLGPTLKLKSIINVPVTSTVRVKGKIEIVSPGKIQITMDRNGTDFKFGAFSPDLPIIDGNTLDRLLFPMIGNVVKPLVEKLAENAINKAMTKAIDDNEDNLDFRSQINDFASGLIVPKQIADDVWLNVNPTKIISTQINGQGPRIYYSAALNFKPFVEYSPVVPTMAPASIPFETAPAIDEKSSLDLKFQVKLKTISELLKTELNKYISEQTTIKKFIRVGEVEIFKTIGNRMAIRINIERKRLFGNWTLFANAYVTNTVKYDSPNGIFTLENIGFTVETKTALLGSILTPIVDTPVENLLQKNAKYSIQDNMRAANKAIRDTTIRLDYGIIHMQFSEIGIANPYVTDINLEAVASLEGKIKFDYIPKDQKPLFTAPLEGGDIDISSELNGGATDIAKSKSKKAQAIKDEQVPLKDLTTFRRVDLFSNRTSEFTKINPMLPNPQIGDTIYVQSNGKVVPHIVRFEDELVSEEILIFVDGKMERARVPVKSNDLAASKSGSPPTINVNEASNYIDRNVVVVGMLSCMEEMIAPSGEKILTLRLGDCNYTDVTLLVYQGSVTDNIPDKSWLNRKISVKAFVGYENGKPTLKIKENGQITLAQ